MNIVVRALPELKSVLISWVAFLLLYFILRKFLYKPVSKFLQARKDRIKADLEGAKILKDEAIVLREDYELRISQAKIESQEIIELGRKRGDEIKNSLIAEGKEEAEKIIDKARKNMEMEREKTLIEAKNQVGDMALLIASKILEKNIDKEEQEVLINKFVNEVGRQEWLN